MIIKPLSEIALNISTGLTPLRSNPVFWDEGTIPWLKTEQLGQKYIYDTNEYITENAISKTNIKIYPPNTLSIAMYGEGQTRGNVSIIKQPMATNQACCNVEIDENKAYYEYVYYYLKTQYYPLRQLSSGIRKNLNSNDIKNYPIRLPNLLSEQKKIAAVLCSLDSKIELNKRINTELEAMVKTLYDYWFVQFDFPCPRETAIAQGKPKLEGKPYKSSGGKMVWNKELKREIPEGCTVQNLEKIITKTGTGLNPRDNFKLGSGTNYYITIKNVKDGKIIFDDKCDKIDDDALKIIDKRADLQPGDILFTSIEPVGVTYLIHEKPLNWNINESVFTIKPNYEKVTSEYLYLLLSGIEMKAYSKNVTAGSIHKGIRHSVLKAFKLPYSSKDLIQQFSEIVKPIFKRINLLDKENIELIKLRDFLLPMLMNGQVKVN